MHTAMCLKNQQSSFNFVENERTHILFWLRPKQAKTQQQNKRECNNTSLILLENTHGQIQIMFDFKWHYFLSLIILVLG